MRERKHPSPDPSDTYGIITHPVARARLTGHDAVCGFCIWTNGGTVNGAGSVFLGTGCALCLRAPRALGSDRLYSVHDVANGLHPIMHSEAEQAIGEALEAFARGFGRWVNPKKSEATEAWIAFRNGADNGT